MKQPSPHQPQLGPLTPQQDGSSARLAISGALLLASPGISGTPALPDGAGPLALDVSAVSRIDTAGLLWLRRTADALAGKGWQVTIEGLDQARTKLMADVDEGLKEKPAQAAGGSALIHIVERIGRATINVRNDGAELLGFLGLVVITLGKSVIQPARIRFTPLLRHIELTGTNALPIVGLLSYLIGFVIAYQGAEQLKLFGAEIYAVNLVGISVLREIGVLMTAIIIAGRSGSAFTAQIGTMKVNQEIDAMRTIGLDPIELLVMPRIIALMVALPLLTFYAMILGLAGGATTCALVLDISLATYLKQLQTAINLKTLMVGLVKAPVFAFVIALVGCYCGMKVASDAESVGLQTTRSVVMGIFLVITLDAAFSVLFQLLGI